MFRISRSGPWIITGSQSLIMRPTSIAMCVPYRSWILNLARIHCQRNYLAPPQRNVLLPGMPFRYRLHLHRNKSIDRRIVYIWLCMTWTVERYLLVSHHVGRVRRPLILVFTSTKFAWYPWLRLATSRCISPFNLFFSSSSKVIYHFERRVLPWRFCISIKRIYLEEGISSRSDVGITSKDKKPRTVSQQSIEQRLTIFYRVWEWVREYVKYEQNFKLQRGSV